MSCSSKLLPLFAALFLGACTTIPAGPSVMVLPGTGKNFEQFRFDDSTCQQYAQSQIGASSANSAGMEAGMKTAALGTVLGAAVGAASDGSRGATSGAAAGLMMGSMAGAGASDATGHAAQRRFDVAYSQCMYAKGHRVPVSGQMQSAPTAPPAPAGYAPPPASGAYYPPPPPASNPPPAR